MRNSFYRKTFPKRKTFIDRKDEMTIENISTGKDRKKSKKHVEIRFSEPHEKLAGLKKRPKKLKISVSCKVRKNGNSL
jgi:hypothetical protein